MLALKLVGKITSISFRKTYLLLFIYNLQNKLYYQFGK